MIILTIVSFFTGLFNIAGIGDWFLEILHKMLLFFDAIAYTLLAYTFKLFQLMCTLNFNSLYGMISGVLTRIEALVMVFVVYKLGISLITFMLNPDEAAKKGKEILINIFVTAALLLSYNTIFTLFNELSMLIIGTPENYNFVVLGEIAEVTGGKDTGLINRLVFGTDEEIPDVGEYIAFSICSSFITDSKDPQNTEPLKKVLSDHGKLNFYNLTDIAAKIGKDYDMFYVVGFVAALYMIYSFVKTTIQVGVRAFKLLILQIMAPIAIITVIGEGLKGKTFKNFLNKYIAVYIEVFIRMFSMLLICNFVVKFIRNIVDYFPTINSDEWYTVALMIVLIIVAAFKFAGDIPKFIDEILSTHLSDNKSGGFGKFMGGLLGFGAGAIAGLAGGIAGGGIGAGALGMLSGAFGGAVNGAKGKNVADWFKAQGQVGKNAKSRGQDIANMGGVGQYMLGGVENTLHMGDSLDRKVAKIDRESAALEAYDKESALELKQGGYTASKMHLTSTAFSTEAMNEVKMSDKEEYKQKMRQYNIDYNNAVAALEATKTRTYSTEAEKEHAISQANLAVAEAMRKSDDDAGQLYEEARLKLANDKDSHTHNLAEKYHKVSNTTGNIDIKAETGRIASNKHKITDRARYARTHGQKPKNNG